MTTWLRGASLHGSGGNAGDGSEARPPAENRHGGAPRGERPASWDAPRLTSADPSRLANATTTQVRLSALRPPLTSGWMRKENERTRAQQRAAGTNNTALFDIVNAATGNGSLRAPRLRALPSRVRASTARPGTQEFRKGSRGKFSPCGTGSRLALAGETCISSRQRALAWPDTRAARPGMMGST